MKQELLYGLIDRKRFPTVWDHLNTHKDWLQERAAARLAEPSPDMPPEEHQHLLWLSMGQPEDAHLKKLVADYNASQP
jgi:hypothetical protein